MIIIKPQIEIVAVPQARSMAVQTSHPPNKEFILPCVRIGDPDLERARVKVWHTSSLMSDPVSARPNT